MKKPVIAAPLLVLTALGWTQERARPVALGEGQMTLEWTPGQEAVVRITAESEEDLERIQVYGPDGRRLLELDTRNGVQAGLSGLEIELRESSLDALLARYAAGTYDIRAFTAQGLPARGSAQLSCDLRPAPRIVHPMPGEIVPTSGLCVGWLADRQAAGYELQLEQGEQDGLRVRLPPARSSFRVPDEFLLPGTETSLEVAAIGSNGNRTVSEVRFFTRP